MGSVVVDVCLVLGLKNSRRDTGLIAALGARWERISNSHFRDAKVLDLQPPSSNGLSCLLGSKPGLPEGVFGYQKASSEVEM